MKVVVDSNVVASLLVATESQSAEAHRLFARNLELSAPAFWEAELANALWKACRRGVLEESAAVERLRRAGRLGIQSVAVRKLWQGALLKAVRTGIAAHDAVFVELAERYDCPLVTFDARLLAAFPARAVRPAEFVA